MPVGLLTSRCRLRCPRATPWLDDPKAPIKKEPGGKSDIDYAMRDNHFDHLALDDQYRDIWRRLPDIDTDPRIGGPLTHPLEFGDKPAIIFFKGRKPLYVPAGLLPPFEE
jgi:hypothetical protein